MLEEGVAEEALCVGLGEAVECVQVENKIRRVGVLNIDVNESVEPLTTTAEMVQQALHLLLGSQPVNAVSALVGQ